LQAIVSAAPGPVIFAPKRIRLKAQPTNREPCNERNESASGLELSHVGDEAAADSLFAIEPVRIQVELQYSLPPVGKTRLGIGGAQKKARRYCTRGPDAPPERDGSENARTACQDQR
jgi:hypothetical protein